MRLQTKLILAFAAVALLPVVVLSLVARLVIANEYRAEFNRELDAAEGKVEQEFQHASIEVSDAVARLARTDDPLMAALLLGLQKGGLGEEGKRVLQDRAEAQRRAFELDRLLISDGAAVLVFAQDPALGSAPIEQMKWLLLRGGRSRLVAEGGGSGEKEKVHPLLESVREVNVALGDGRGTKVQLLGGRLLDARFLERLSARARLLSPSGAVLAEKDEPSHAHDLRRHVELGGDLGVTVEVGVSDEELRRTLESVNLATFALGGGTLILALLFGATVARRITEPVRRLGASVEAIGRGDLDTRVEVRSRDELGELGNRFNSMAADLKDAHERLRLSERLAAWREVAQRIAHEIKNPLTPIQMAIETLRRARTRSAERFDVLFEESSRTILDEVERLKTIVAEFSRFGRMPAPVLSPVDLRAVIEGTLSLYAGGEVEVSAECASTGLIALADRDQIQQVLLNLVENARDAALAGTRRPPRVVVRARAAEGGGGGVEFEVADSGCGLTADSRAQLFTPYFTTKSRGTGLGLAIVHRIVTDHGGVVRVGAAAEGGARFSILLPGAAEVR